MARRGISDAERRAWNRVLGAGFVLVVGGSAGLLALRGGGSPVEIAGITLAGLLFGALLLWYLARIGRPGRDRQRR